MNKSELAPLIDSLIPGLYGFGYCLVPDELQAEQLVVDAYSVFLIRDGQNLRDLDLAGGSKERARAKRYIQNQMLADMFDLGKKRAPQLRALFRNLTENQDFYGLELAQRACLYAKEHLGCAHEDLEEIFAMKKHQIVELLHNARVLMRSETIDDREHFAK